VRRRGSNRLPLRFTKLSFAAALPAICGSAAALLSQITVKVSVVNIPVTVTGCGGAFVDGLQRENFHVLVDGTERRIAYFSPEEEPARVLVLVETGPAVYLLRREQFRCGSGNRPIRTIQTA
jgi:hypothetical protein